MRAVIYACMLYLRSHVPHIQLHVFISILPRDIDVCFACLSDRLLLVNPVVLGLLPAVELLLLEPQVNLLLRGLDAVGAVADIAADVLAINRS